MDTTLFITFLFVSFGLIVVPGPNVLVIVGTSVTHGKTRGLQTVAGTTLAMAAQLFIAAVTTASFTHLLAEGFDILKWVGVLYLFYLGFTQVRRAVQSNEASNDISATATFSRGFIVSITNPKTIMFFGAFLPQFISASGSYTQQITILSLTFLLLASALDSCYAVLASRLALFLAKPYMSRFQRGFSGLVYWGAGAWLATLRRTQ